MSHYLFNREKYAPGIVMPVGIYEGSTKRIKSIEFCAAGEFRFRKIVARSSMRPTGKFSSWKMVRSPQWESPNEKNAFYDLDFKYNVLAYREQSCEIIYIDDEGNEAAHYPDIDAITLGGIEILEVKPKEFADQPCVKRRTDLLMVELAPFKIKYDMLHAENLRHEPRFSTKKKILQFGHRPVGPIELAEILSQLAKSGTLNWAAAKRGAYGPYGREILCRLTLEGRLSVNVEAPLNDHSEFIPGPLGD
jgi:hypothetical protein